MEAYCQRYYYYTNYPLRHPKHRITDHRGPFIDVCWGLRVPCGLRHTWLQVAPQWAQLGQIAHASITILPKPMPGRSVAQNLGLLCLNTGLLWGTMADYFQLLGFSDEFQGCFFTEMDCLLCPVLSFGLFGGLYWGPLEDAEWMLGGSNGPHAACYGLLWGLLIGDANWSCEVH